MQKIKSILLVFLLVLVVYTRFVNLSWGLPYPFHPDERNMAVALQGLKCDDFEFLKQCMNPHFFAYGQLPLYLGYLLIQLLHFVLRLPSQSTSFVEATLALRVISAISSLFTVWVGIKIVELIGNKNEKLRAKMEKQQLKTKNLLFTCSILVFTFSPGLIQFAHFGTTESFLMLLYFLITYLCIQIVSDDQLAERPKRPDTITARHIALIAFCCSAAIATKISSIIFLALPMLVIVWKTEKMYAKFMYIICLVFLTGVFSILLSPHNLISWPDFVSSIRYEADIGTGRLVAFYTKQFFDTTPVIFQFLKIFPYALGWPVFILFLVGFITLPWDKKHTLLRAAFLIYFIPTAFLYAKWTRFMAPILPLMITFAILTISNIKNKISKLQIKDQKFYILPCLFTFSILVFTLITPGIVYLSIYQKPDVRFQASEWIYKNISANAYILSETANVVDIPIPTRNEKLETRNYNIISFDFYNLDENPLLQSKLQEHLTKADYIFIPSRRIFTNHICLKNFQSNLKCQKLKQTYPLLNQYYEDLFSGKLGFREIAEFNSYPKLESGNLKLEFPDEQAEETWTVFDHPVIRVYKRI